MRFRIFLLAFCFIFWGNYAVAGVCDGTINEIRNSAMVGANSAGNILPYRWQFNNGSFSSIVVNEVGQEGELYFIDVSITGTNLTGSTKYPSIDFEKDMGIATEKGDTWAYSAYIKDISSSHNAVRLQLIERQNGTFISSSQSIANLTGSLIRYNKVATVQSELTTHIQPRLYWTVGNNETMSVRVMIYTPQVESGTVITDAVPTFNTFCEISGEQNPNNLDEVVIDVSGYTHMTRPQGHGRRSAIISGSFRYPSRDQNMQWMFFDNNFDRGLYIKTDDPVGYLADWSVTSDDKLKIHFYGPNRSVIAKQTNYVDPIMAANEYRQWAVGQSWYINAKQNRPVGMSDIQIIAVAPGHDQNFLQTTAKNFLAQFSQKTGVWITQWRKDEFDHNYPNYEMVSTAGVKNFFQYAKEHNQIAFPYINGNLSDRTGSLYDQRMACLNSSGATIQYNARDLPDLIIMDPADSRWQQIIVDARNSLLDNDGQMTFGVYFDVTAATMPFLCYNTDHGHIPGDPYSWQRGTREILSKLAGKVIAEGVAEIYVDVVDGSLMHDRTGSYDDGNLVPLWNTVYGDLNRSVGWHLNHFPVYTPSEMNAQLDKIENSFHSQAWGSPFMSSTVQDTILGSGYENILQRIKAGRQNPVTYSLAEFIVLASQWLRSAMSSMDLNSDGVINAKDLGVMMGKWQ